MKSTIHIFLGINSSVCDEIYRISDMIPVALPPRVAGDGLEDLTSYFVQYNTYVCTLSGWVINTCNEPSHRISNWD